MEGNFSVVDFTRKLDSSSETVNTLLALLVCVNHYLFLFFTIFSIIFLDHDFLALLQEGSSSVLSKQHTKTSIQNIVGYLLSLTLFYVNVERRSWTVVLLDQPKHLVRRKAAVGSPLNQTF